MGKTKVWYTLEKANGVWTIWENTEIEKANGGSGGNKKVYSSQNKQDCLGYCKTNKIKLKGKKK
jgi:hypothetical protein